MVGSCPAGVPDPTLRPVLWVESSVYKRRHLVRLSVPSEHVGACARLRTHAVPMCLYLHPWFACMWDSVCRSWLAVHSLGTVVRTPSAFQQWSWRPTQFVVQSALVMWPCAVFPSARLLPTQAACQYVAAE